ncbi:catalase [Nocardiopsis lambiniae]|uniref:Catalase n=1 Tax=Nocardiopsis lambiniae TaxID=3075539 RepID=A0ABU2M7Z4_9ACTN|nr:catalase [Nocardiopsis sp. DSM 44743]MDT0328361.1 catalase [Nocardiopsis sp. DSM 44743]
MNDETRDAKDRRLDADRTDSEGPLTTDTGVRVEDTDNSLTAGARGPTLLEDFHAREKITHFDHERIPERVVHARGAGAYGRFRPYEDLSDLTAAHFLSGPDVVTPVFVRFSTVAGSRGSADTVRDVRGFAVKFYTEQGNYDLVGNNMPVFFIQDGIKFPDFVHAVKPEPHNEIPQAQSAHDTLWDFVGLQPETTHMMMWLMSDRAIPRSYRTMQGFGVHTFRFVNARGEGVFVKFHWKPMLGTHSLVWDEAQRIQGKDPDFNRRDLWESIERGQYPEWELGVQLVPEEDEHAFDFDLLDATKIIPEEEVPVRPIGRLTLDRNPDNFFAETEQVAFHTANVVPGIDFTNDPLLQARNFSYLDTQLLRLGGSNFQQIPVNRPVAPVDNNQRDGFAQHRVHRGGTSYFPNSLGGGCPAMADEGVHRHYTEKVEGRKIRERAESFKDHYSQATLFYNSLASWEREHLVAAFRFELGKCEELAVRQRVVTNLDNVDHGLASAVAEGVGVEAPEEETTPNHGRSSPALSQAETTFGSVVGRQVAILVADGVDAASVEGLREPLIAEGAIVELLAATDGAVRTTDGGALTVDRALPTMSSVLYDAVAVPDGADAVAVLSDDGLARHFVLEAYKHHKPLVLVGAGAGLAIAPPLPERVVTPARRTREELGVIVAPESDDICVAEFTRLIGLHRNWDRPTGAIPA